MDSKGEIRYGVSRAVCALKKELALAE